MSATENQHPSARPQPADEPAPASPRNASGAPPARGIPRPTPRPQADASSNAPPPLRTVPRPVRRSDPDPRPPQGSDPDGRPSMDSDPDAHRGFGGVAGPRSDRNAITLPAPPREPETSIEIPPPAEVAQDRPPGSKDPYIGTTFDHRYRIERLLGEGGMGFVYLARHKVIDKKVAVKVLRAELAKDEEIFERFVQEARAASSVGNPHIVDVSDFGDLPDGSKYFVMEYLDGVSLSQIIDGPDEIPMERIYKVGLEMSDGLAAAHNAGIIHRDLKPDNVYVVQRGNDPDFVKILDFGIAKVTNDAENKITRAGAVFGTPHYMSPEQAAGAPIDHRTDIYSLGVMIYELVSRQLPFTADNFMGILTQHMYKAPVPPRALVSGPGVDCPPPLEAIILKCLSKKPEARYQTMEELHADLATARSGGVPKAVPEMMARSGGFNVPQDYFKPKPTPQVTPAPSSAKTRSRPGYLWIAGSAAAIGLAAGIAVLASGPGEAPATSLPAPSARPESAPTLAPTPAPAPSAPPVEPPVAPSVKKVTVTVAATPEAAMAYLDGQPIQLPSPFEVEEGKHVTIEIKADGYISQTVELDGTEQRKTVKLKEAPKSTGARTASPTVTTTNKEIRDPWEHQPQKRPPGRKP
jgi:serine/threonine-protein kinase